MVCIAFICLQCFAKLHKTDPGQLQPPTSRSYAGGARSHENGFGNRYRTPLPGAHSVVKRQSGLLRYSYKQTQSFKITLKKCQSYHSFSLIFLKVFGEATVTHTVLMELEKFTSFWKGNSHFQCRL